MQFRTVGVLPAPIQISSSTPSKQLPNIFFFLNKRADCYPEKKNRFGSVMMIWWKLFLKIVQGVFSCNSNFSSCTSKFFQNFQNILDFFIIFKNFLFPYIYLPTDTHSFTLFSLYRKKTHV